VRALREESLDRLPAANPPADLHLERAVAQNVADEILVGAASGCRVEVHEMKSPEAVGGPAADDRQRIVETDPFLLVGSTDELHAGATAQIHCRNRDHRRASSRKA
jgi:hypothetical protein